MPKYIKKKALKNAIECCTWYHINKNGELVEGANPDYHEPLYKHSDIKKIIKGLPTRKFEDEPYIDIETGILHWCGWKYRRIYEGEPQTMVYPQVDGITPSVIVKDEPKTGYCNECKWFGDKQVCGICRSKHLYEPKDEPQTDCPYREYPCAVCDEQTDCQWK